MRTTITAILAIAAFVLICSEPAEETNFIVTFMWSKALGFTCAYTAYRIGRRDGRLRKRIERLTRLTDET